MNTTLSTINLINTKDDVLKKSSNKSQNKDFQSSIYEEEEKINRENNDVKEIDKKDISKEDEESTDDIEKDNYKYDNYIYAIQSLQKNDTLDVISYKKENLINNMPLQGANLQEESNKNNIEILDIQYLTDNTEDKNIDQLKDIYEISYKSSSKEQFDLDIIPDNSERIKSSDEIDILGKISMIGPDKKFDKSISLEIEQLQNLQNTDIESRINDEAIKNIKLMKTEDIKELSIKLRPRELGDMHIKLLQENDTLKAVITVSDKDVYNIMNKNLSELKQHLDTFNVKEISIVVDSENNYSSDSFDKRFEDNRRRSEHESNKKNKNRNNAQTIVEDKSIYIKEEGINLLA